MKHFFYSILLCLVFSIGLQAQIPLNLGGGTQGFGTGWDDASSITYDTQENIYVTGYFSSDSIRFGNIILYNQGAADMYIVKYDLGLAVQWAISVGGSGNEYGMGITADSSSNLVVVGNFESSSIVMGNDTLTNLSAGTPDMFIARIDVNGNFLWARREGTTNWDNCSSVDMNPWNGDIYVAGSYYLDDMMIGTDTFPNRGGYDMILMKFDLVGNYIWARDAGGNFNDLGNGVCYDNNGYAYVSGGFASDTLNFPGDTLINPMMGMPDIFVVKYDQSGNYLWSRRAGSIDNDHSVSVDTDGSQVYVVGHYHSSSFTFGSDTLVNQGMGDVFILAYDSNGNPMWAKGAGGADHDFGYHVWVDNGSRIYFSGMFMSSSITFGTFTHNNMMTGMEDLYLTMYDAFGFASGSLSGGGMGADYLSSLISNIAGIYMVGGFTSITMWNGAGGFTNTDATGNTGDPMVLMSSIPLAVSSTAVENNFSVYPNPGNGMFSFSSTEIGVVNVVVYNTLGEAVIMASNQNAKYFNIDLADQPNGIYYVQMNSGDAVSTVKVVKQ